MFTDEFSFLNDLIHLNHAGVGPWPKRAAVAAAVFAQENAELGSTNYPAWTETESTLRQQFQRLINAPESKDIALLKNTSEALSVVAFGLPWTSGENVVGILEEFPSNRLPWQALSKRHGIEWRGVSVNGADDPEARLIESCDDQTRVMAVSAVQYASGLRLNLPRLGEFCRQRGILFCVDAIQQLGALPFDVQEVQADFVAADAHKWMLGPEGVALFYVRAEIRDQIQLQQYGWHMIEEMAAFDRLEWEPAHSARRFECGSPNNLAIHIQSASLSLLEEIGIPEIAKRVEERVGYTLELANERGFAIYSAEEPERRAGIVTFAPPNCDISKLYQGLMSQSVLCASRMNGIRFSPHFYTPLAKIQSAFDIVDDTLQMIR